MLMHPIRAVWDYNLQKSEVWVKQLSHWGIRNFQEICVQCNHYSRLLITEARDLRRIQGLEGYMAGKWLPRGKFIYQPASLEIATLRLELAHRSYSSTFNAEEASNASCVAFNTQYLLNTSTLAYNPINGVVTSVST